MKFKLFYYIYFILFHRQWRLLNSSVIDDSDATRGVTANYKLSHVASPSSAAVSRKCTEIRLTSN